MTEDWKDWEGDSIDRRFPLQHYLGGSEHSAVFLTEFGDQRPQRAAVKLIPADPNQAELQLSRWEMAAALDHPHLIRIFRTGRCQLRNRDLLYLLMEYAEEDLSQILPARPLTPAEARQMLFPVVDALAYLHAKGLVHGHLKPSNIMAVDDQLKVSTDGVYRAGEWMRPHNQPGTYNPPEIATEAISPAADVWSLGITLVESLTQQLPAGEARERGEPVLPEQLPEPFLDIARHCLRGDPRRRWTVAQIRERLQQPSTPHVEKQVRVRLHKSVAKWPYVVAIALALLAIVAVPRLISHRPEPSRPPSRAPEQLQTQRPKKGFIEGTVATQFIPQVPQSARDTIRGTVRVAVRVSVDPSGTVNAATLDSPGPSKYFANVALQAARRWKFTPRKVDGREVSSEWILQFQFERTGTKVLPTQSSPR